MASQQQILVVDDSLLARMMLKKFVANLRPEAQIIEGKDGKDALGKIEGKSIDVALVDYNMPGMTGIDLAKRLKDLFPGISIALITANIQDYIAKEAKNLGVDFISKPIEQVNIEAFLNSVRK